MESREKLQVRYLSTAHLEVGSQTSADKLAFEMIIIILIIMHTSSGAILSLYIIS